MADPVRFALLTYRQEGRAPFAPMTRCYMVDVYDRVTFERPEDTPR